MKPHWFKLCQIHDVWYQIGQIRPPRRLVWWDVCSSTCDAEWLTSLSFDETEKRKTDMERYKRLVQPCWLPIGKTLIRDAKHQISKSKRLRGKKLMNKKIKTNGLPRWNSRTQICAKYKQTQSGTWGKNWFVGLGREYTRNRLGIYCRKNSVSITAEDFRLALEVNQFPNQSFRWNSYFSVTYIFCLRYWWNQVKNYCPEWDHG